ncbi:MAG: PSD1 domain-containing protein [Verrucomicrobiaceae bacterium]|nr:PSD1 domain-containing protein [Verrucomicrobiaceae bacterium]
MRFLALFITLPAFAVPVDFVREVRPIFEKHCYECHGEKKQKSGLRLDVKSAAFKGGDNHAPDIVPGKASESPLVQFLTSDDEDEVMPPKGKLAAAEIETLTRWIHEGASWPDGVDLAKVEDKRDHWAFKPIQSVEQRAKGKEIDAFIDAKLSEKGLHRSQPADPVTWLRRVTFDLTGLPPTPEEVAEFDRSYKSHGPYMTYSSAVDRLLASPRYGERWAQHWLDVVRYADTHGFEVNTERPHAWPYRDYVIRAFNADTPFDRFIKEQIVGDSMGMDEATGFLVTASVLLPGQIGKDAPSIRLARQDSLDEMVTNIGQTFLGLSVGCARCHDHKFDPISAKDYYAMQALVAGVEYADRELRTPKALARKKEAATARQRDAQITQRLTQLSPMARPGKKEGVQRPTVRATMNIDRIAPVRTKRVRFTIRETNSLEPCLDELEVFNTAGVNVALASAGAKLKTSGDKISRNRHEPAFIHDGRYGNERSWMSNEKGKGWVEIEFAREEEISHIAWSRDRLEKLEDRVALNYAIEIGHDKGWLLVADASDRRPHQLGLGAGPEFVFEGLPETEAKEIRRLLNERGSLLAKIKAGEQGQLAFAGTFREPDDIHLLNRGDPEQPKESVMPAVLSALGDVKLTDATPELKRRQALADWIASPQNTLTARVMVNRIWQGHFGTGLVATPSDFGRMGMKPTHPELLDWLASEFIRSGWSVKHLHRLIVLSGTYGQSSFGFSRTDAAKAATTLDSESKYLWRFPSRRIEAETLRDSMLAVSGKLNFTMYGRGFDLFDKRGGLSGFKPVETFKPENQRRMIYAHKVRREPETVFGAFDCPDAGQSTALRRASTTPIQALNLFNSRFTLEHAHAFAERVKREAGGDAAAQIRRAYELALSRKPTTAESNDTLPLVKQHGASVLCRALFNSNEFLFIP